MTCLSHQGQNQGDSMTELLLLIILDPKYILFCSSKSGACLGISDYDCWLGGRLLCFDWVLPKLKHEPLSTHFHRGWHLWQLLGSTPVVPASTFLEEWKAVCHCSQNGPGSPLYKRKALEESLVFGKGLWGIQRLSRVFSRTETSLLLNSTRILLHKAKAANRRGGIKFRCWEGSAEMGVEGGKLFSILEINSRFMECNKQAPLSWSLWSMSPCCSHQG